MRRKKLEFNISKKKKVKYSEYFTFCNVLHKPGLGPRGLGSAKGPNVDDAGGKNRGFFIALPES